MNESCTCIQCGTMWYNDTKINNYCIHKRIVALKNVLFKLAASS